MGKMTKAEVATARKNLKDIKQQVNIMTIVGGIAGAAVIGILSHFGGYGSIPYEPKLFFWISVVVLALCVVGSIAGELTKVDLQNKLDQNDKE